MVLGPDSTDPGASCKVPCPWKNPGTSCPPSPGQALSSPTSSLQGGLALLQGLGGFKGISIYWESRGPRAQSHASWWLHELESIFKPAGEARGKRLEIAIFCLFTPQILTQQTQADRLQRWAPRPAGYLGETPCKQMAGGEYLMH